MKRTLFQHTTQRRRAQYAPGLAVCNPWKWAFLAKKCRVPALEHLLGEVVEGTWLHEADSIAFGAPGRLWINANPRDRNKRSRSCRPSSALRPFPAPRSEAQTEAGLGWRSRQACVCRSYR